MLICTCGNETNEPTGVCVVCQFDMRLGRKTPENVGVDLSVRPDGGGEMAAKEKARCEGEGCKKSQWKERRCMVHFNEKHGIVRTRKWTKKKAKILPKPMVSLRAEVEKKESIIESLMKERDEHRHALLELEAILNGISKYAGIIIPI